MIEPQSAQLGASAWAWKANFCERPSCMLFDFEAPLGSVPAGPFELAGGVDRPVSGDGPDDSEAVSAAVCSGPAGRRLVAVAAGDAIASSGAGALAA
jgi:hypothetical protein